MSKLEDKLTASINPLPATPARPSAKPSTKRTSKGNLAQTKAKETDAAIAKPVSKPLPSPDTPAPAPDKSTPELHPRRIWPD